MLTSITYNCDPDSLADISPEDFVDAFEAVFAGRLLYRDLSVHVTFEREAKSGITDWAVDDDDEFSPQQLDDMFRPFAEDAFNACRV